jgi:hypothetical protein
MLCHHFSLKWSGAYQIMKSLGHELLSTSEIYLEKVFEKRTPSDSFVVWGIYIEEDLHIQRGFCDFWRALKRSSFER